MRKFLQVLNAEENFRVDLNGLYLHKQEQAIPALRDKEGIYVEWTAVNDRLLQSAGISYVSCSSHIDNGNIRFHRDEPKYSVMFRMHDVDLYVNDPIPFNKFKENLQDNLIDLGKRLSTYLSRPELPVVALYSDTEQYNTYTFDLYFVSGSGFARNLELYHSRHGLVRILLGEASSDGRTYLRFHPKMKVYDVRYPRT